MKIGQIQIQMQIVWTNEIYKSQERITILRLLCIACRTADVMLSCPKAAFARFCNRS